MGGSFSMVKATTKMKHYFNDTDVNEIINQYNIISKNINKIIIRNVAEISNLTAKQQLFTKNVMLADMVLKKASQYNIYDQVNQEVQKEMKSDGLFSMNVGVSELYNEMIKHIDINHVNRSLNSIQSSFNVENMFIIENDKLIPTSKAHNINVEQTNESYNDQAYKSLLDIVNNLDEVSKMKIKDNLKSSSTGINSTWLLSGALLVGAIFLVVSAVKKK
jgi:predicted DNA-binding protein YlxM (UPF0122 family)